MTTSSTRPKESSILGESWVVTNPWKDEQQSASSIVQEKQEQDPSSSTSCNPVDLSASTATDASFASAMSGPELIMPSICDEPIAEASWIAPKMRGRRRESRESQSKSKTAIRSESPQKKDDKSKTEPESSEADANPRPTPPTAPPRGIKDHILQSLSTILQNHETEKLLRTTLTFFLLLPILHILVLPELLYQYPSLCNILPSASTLYPASCSSSTTTRNNPHRSGADILPSKYESILTSHAHLERLLNSTIQDLQPLVTITTSTGNSSSTGNTSPFKRSESSLRDLHAQLKTTYPDSKHELDLEFEGAWAAARTASREFDSLRAEIGSSVDHLRTQGARFAPSSSSSDEKGEGSDQKKNGSLLSRLFSTSSSSSDKNNKNKKNNLPFQISRHSDLLDKTTSQLRSKADSLLGRIATLDDHLESIEEIVSRATTTTTTTIPGSESDPESDTTVSKLISSLPSSLQKLLFFHQLVPVPAESALRMKNETLLSSVRQAGEYHRGVGDVAGRLEKGLSELQLQQGRR
ncbi:hypothetical protein VTN00DRAFT_9463 [Thermoascus crustaceus]|uniref:uncharacterized protein n=1 Tax=Thermoascus crustaceus TaxID=5088 RepID=UPI0037443D28